MISKFNATSTPKGSYSAETGDNDCNVNSNRYSLRTALWAHSLSGQVWTKCRTRPDTQGVPWGGCSHTPLFSGEKADILGKRNTIWMVYVTFGHWHKKIRYIDTVSCAPVLIYQVTEWSPQNRHNNRCMLHTFLNHPIHTWMFFYKGKSLSLCQRQASLRAVETLQEGTTSVWGGWVWWYSPSAGTPSMLQSQCHADCTRDTAIWSSWYREDQE